VPTKNGQVLAFTCVLMKNRRQMKEDNKEKSLKPEIPDDAVLVTRTGPLEFYFSKSEDMFLVGMPGSRAVPVRIARPEIINLLNILGPLVEDVQHAREKEEQLVAELECDEDDF
jgi:hypothetical protein